MLSWYDRITKHLHWTTPHVWLPHGLFGVGLFVLGLAFMIQALLGPQGPNALSWGYTPQGPQPKWLLHMYHTCVVMNALGGLRMVYKAPLYARPFFRVGAFLLIGLTWCSWRLTSLTLPEMQALDQEPSARYQALLHVVDQTVAFMLVGLLVGIFVTSLAWSILKGPALAAVVMPIATLGVSVLSLLIVTFPVSLALYGSDWYHCIVVEEFPYQRAVFGNYVYVPATWGFATPMFGITLYFRKIISLPVMAVGVVGTILVLLVATTLALERYISGVATSKLLLWCQTDADGNAIQSEWAEWEEALDLSLWLRGVLSAWNVTLIPPPTTTFATQEL